MTRRGMSTADMRGAAGMPTTTAPMATAAARMSLGDNRRSAHPCAQYTRSQNEASIFGTHGTQSPITPNVYNAAGAKWCTPPTQFSNQSDRNAALNIM
jgi:hypothetical protein